MIEKNIRIAVISNMYPAKDDPSYGSFVYNFVGDLADKPIFSLDLIVIRGRSYKTAVKVWKYAQFYWQIFFFLLTRKYDIVYVHIITHASPVLRLVSIFKRLNLVFNIHGEDLLVKTKRSKLLLSIAYPLLCNSLKIVVPSMFFKNKLQNRFPVIKDQKIFISPSGGINKVHFCVNRKVDQFTGAMAYVSRIDRGKGWDVVLDAIELLNKRSKLQLRCLFVGGGAEVDRFKKRIEEKKLDNCIYRGVLPQKELRNIYQMVDLMIFPTELEESLGLVGVEALSCSCPVIGSDIGCLPEYIHEGVTGFLFEPGNSTDLADKIEYFYSLKMEEVNKMREEAYAISLKYDSESTSRLMVELLIGLVH